MSLFDKHSDQGFGSHIHKLLSSYDQPYGFNAYENRFERLMTSLGMNLHSYGYTLDIRIRRRQGNHDWVALSAKNHRRTLNTLALKLEIERRCPLFIRQDSWWLESGPGKGHLDI